MYKTTLSFRIRKVLPKSKHPSRFKRNPFSRLTKNYFIKYIYLWVPSITVHNPRILDGYDGK